MNANAEYATLLKQEKLPQMKWNTTRLHQEHQVATGEHRWFIAGQSLKG